MAATAFSAVGQDDDTSGAHWYAMHYFLYSRDASSRRSTSENGFTTRETAAANDAFNILYMDTFMGEIIPE